MQSSPRHPAVRWYAARMLNALMWGGGALVSLFLLYLTYMIVRTVRAGRGSRIPEGLSAVTELPARARVGEQLQLVVRVTNSLDRQRTLTNTDLEDSLVKGFEVVSIEPAPVERSDSPVLGTWVYQHKRPLAPHETVSVTFGLRAAKPGTFGGDVTVYVDGDHFRWIALGVAVEIEP